jgi:hypothetical protein
MVVQTIDIFALLVIDRDGERGGIELIKSKCSCQFARAPNLNSRFSPRRNLGKIQYLGPLERSLLFKFEQQ